LLSLDSFQDELIGPLTGSFAGAADYDFIAHNGAGGRVAKRFAPVRDHFRIVLGIVQNKEGNFIAMQRSVNDFVAAVARAPLDHTAEMLAGKLEREDVPSLGGPPADDVGCAGKAAKEEAENDWLFGQITFPLCRVAV